MAKELGRIGQRRYSGVFFEEFLPELRGARGAEVYTEMADNDSTIGAILFAIENLMRNCTFTVEPGGKSKADEEAAEFVQGCMDDMCMTWTDTLSEILSFITYGWSYHEIVYKRRLGKRTGQDSSKYDDGLIGWKKLPIRSQETLYEWKYKPHSDDLLGMEQWIQTDMDSEQVVIPIEKALHFVTKSRKQNPEGRSILRTAYRDWYFKKRIQEIEGVGIERDLCGYPTLEAPEGYEQLWDSEDQEMAQYLANAQNIISNIRRDKSEGLVVPPGWKLQLVSTGSRRQFDTNQIIERYDKKIATSVLTDFVLIGHESVGSFALADNKTKMFALAVGTYLDIICEGFNNQAIPRLIDLNGDKFKGITDYPYLKHGDIEDANLEKIGNFIQQMVGSGAITPDDELEDYLREIANLPERSVDVPMEQRTGQVDPAAQQDQMTGDGENGDMEGQNNGKQKSATMYEIKSVMADYLAGRTSKNMATTLLRHIGISDKDINAYIADYDALRADNERKQAEKDRLKQQAKVKPSAEARAEQKKESDSERDIDDEQDRKEAEEAKKSLGRIPWWNRRG